jgi:SAM-dependent methyltransferase
MNSVIENPVSTTSDRYLDGSYAIGNPDWHQADSAWKAERIFEIIDRNRIKLRSVCDLGCGAGEVLACLKRKLDIDVVCVGYEPSPQAFSIAQTKTTSGLSFSQASALDEKAHFDAILLIDVIEHLDDYIGYLRNVQPHADYFILHIPLDLSVLSLLRDWPIMKRRRGVGHLHYFTKSTALATLEDLGFKVIDFFYTEIRRPSEENFKTTLLRRFPLSCFCVLGLRDLGVRIFGDHSLMILAQGPKAQSKGSQTSSELGHHARPVVESNPSLPDSVG